MDCPILGDSCSRSLCLIPHFPALLPLDVDLCECISRIYSFTVTVEFLPSHGVFKETSWMGTHNDHSNIQGASSKQWDHPENTKYHIVLFYDYVTPKKRLLAPKTSQ